MNTMERLMDKVHFEPNTGCWIFFGCQVKGYGHIMNGEGKQVKAHRLSYEMHVGPIPDGMVIDHVRARGCSTTACVNPAHLEPVTISENTLRGEGITAMFAKVTHCPSGHEYTPENTCRGRRGRSCRACARIACRKLRAKRKK